MRDASVDPDLRSRLLSHYDRRGRSLPWRGETDPYRILVSEVMLQQTRVETVKRYYEPWLDRFPTLEALADASIDDVLKSWEGLGYYRRARNLHRAAVAVRERPDGRLPRDHDGLRALPGVGVYTAGAVGSIAFGIVAPAVDGNVRRVLSRLYDEPSPSPTWLQATAGALVDPERPGDWNQALMELGATICTPRAPACEECPVADWCRALAAGTVGDRPRRTPRAAVATARFVVCVFERGDRVLMARRPAGGLLGGMWSFPEAEHDGSDAVDAIDRSAARFGVRRTDRPAPLPVIEHRFTHLHAVYEPHLVRVEDGSGRASGAGRAGNVGGAAPTPEHGWFSCDGAGALALPVAQRAILEAWRETVGAAENPEEDGPR